MYLPLWIISIIFALVIIILYSIFFLGRFLGKINAQRELDKSLPALKKDLLNRSRSILRGQLAEQFAPILPGFPFRKEECHFIGKPIDFIVFQDVSEENGNGYSQNQPSVVFVEVKSGSSQLSVKEKRIKDAVQRKRVYWYEYRVPF